MRKIIFIFLMLFCHYLGRAQTNTTCAPFISADWYSDCNVTNYLFKPTYLHDSTDCFITCKGSRVLYFAENVPSGSTATWSIMGASSYIAVGNMAEVYWSFSGSSGLVQLTVTDSTGIECTAERCIKLIDLPNALINTSPPSTTVTGVWPAATEMFICLNQIVEFDNLSTGSSGAPIQETLWEVSNGNGLDWFSPNNDLTYQFTDQGEYTVRLTVTNQCGCKDIKEVFVHVGEKKAIELSCYGTACPNTMATYKMMNPPCDQSSYYNISVTGGTLVSTANFPFITVQWGNPTSGIGIISIDAHDCPDACQSLSYAEIPIISNHTHVSGPSTVCVGDIVKYELPLWGSTQYTWHIASNTGFSQINGLTPNIKELSFAIPGTYHIWANYENTFLNDVYSHNFYENPCGPFSSDTLNLVVKPIFRIHASALQACPGDTLTFNALDSISNPVYCNWMLYDDSNNLLDSTTTTPYSHSFIFQNSGSYKITAHNSQFCKDVEVYVTIHTKPSALTSATGDLQVCTNSAYEYHAIASEDQCYVNWFASCCSPTHFDGDYFTANFGSTLCNVLVTQTNQNTHCKSDPYVLNISPLTYPAVPHDTLHACPGDVINYSTTSYTNVLYEWSISAGNASILGDRFTNNVSVSVLGNATLKLTRKYCSTYDVTYIPIMLYSSPTPVITSGNSFCEGIPYTLTCNLSSNLTWKIDGVIINPVNYEFNTAGSHTVEVSYQPGSGCPATIATQLVSVNTRPQVHVSEYVSSGVKYLTATINGTGSNTYHWSTGQTTQTIAVTPTSGFTYCDTLYPANGCPATWDCYTFISTSTSQLCPDSLTIDWSFDCNTFTFVANGFDTLSNTQVNWSFLADGISAYSYGGTLHDSLFVTFNAPGFHTFSATWFDSINNCTMVGVVHILVPLIPHFNYQISCGTTPNQLLVTFSDQSEHLGSYPAATWWLDGINMGTSSQLSLQSDSTYYICMEVAYSYTHPGTGQVFSDTCLICDTIHLFPKAHAAFSVSPSPYCAMNPIHFTNTSTGALTNYWVFNISTGDDSYIANVDYAYQNSGLSSNPSSKLVSLTVTDAYSCTSTASTTLSIRKNLLEGEAKNYLNTHVCKGTPLDVAYKFTIGDYTQPFSGIYYQWLQNNILDTNNNHWIGPTQTGFYYVNLSDVYGCTAQSAYLNLGFLNTPIAHILGLTNVCLGNAISFNGNIGSEFTYHWVIYEDYGSHDTVFTSSASNISFTSTHTGNHVVSLTLWNGSCFDTDVLNFTVSPKPPTPHLYFGNNMCIDHPAVDVLDSAGNNLNWSNGFTNTSISYFNAPGWITANYVDPQTGCKSNDDSLLIPTAPDFDCLLTGCYEVCPGFFKDSLNTFLNAMRIYWIWNWDNDSIQGGGPASSAVLLTPGYGTYDLLERYAGDCWAQSPPLLLQEKHECACDSLFAKPDPLICKVQDCQLVYEACITLENHSHTPITITGISNPAMTILSTSPSFPFTLSNYLSSQTVCIQLTLNSAVFLNSIVFDIHATDYNNDPCYSSLTFNMANTNSCIVDTCNFSISETKFCDEGSSPAFSEFDFIGYILTGLSNVLVSSNYGTIGFIGYIPDNGYVKWRFGIDHASLVNLADSGAIICFDILACKNDTFCRSTYCVPAADLLALINSKTPSVAKPILTQSLSSQTNDFPYKLQPNPAKHFVSIIGAENSIQEVSLMSLQGTIILRTKESQVNLEKITLGTYLVRIITKDNLYYYLKLIKE